jgi:16S rRNA (cytidine1402-2'-O)-methyltransferase
MKNGKLYLVSTPIGNPDDFTFTAEKVLKSVDLLVCEEWKNGKALMRRFDLSCEITRLNEHNAKDETDEILKELKNGKKVALTSDAGTPVFSDPGAELVAKCHKSNVEVSHVSGASSLISALVVSGLPIEPFYYLGWLPRKKDEREKLLKKLKNEKATTVIMETPYRLVPLLEAVSNVLGKNREITIARELTSENEKIYRGKVGKLLENFKKVEEKFPFVLLIAGTHYKKIN